MCAVVMTAVVVDITEQVAKDLKASFGDEIQVYQMKGPARFQGEIIMKYQNTLMNFEYLLLKNHWTNFKWRATPFSKGR